MIYCFNCLHSLTTENKLKSHEKVWKKKAVQGTVLEFNQYIQSEKIPYMLTMNL